jgi:hypothetical protein
MGDTAEEAKQEALNGLLLFVKHNKPENIPDILKRTYDIVYKFDAESFLNDYKKIFTNAALERITGINQKQLQHYSTGLKKPRPAQINEIKTAMHNLGKELMSLDL